MYEQAFPPCFSGPLDTASLGQWDLGNGSFNLLNLASQTVQSVRFFFQDSQVPQVATLLWGTEEHLVLESSLFLPYPLSYSLSTL